MITTEIVTVTPELAREWLKANTKNRPLDKRKVGQYANDMKSGNWPLNGEAIKFGESKRLFDGQHRLKAVDESGVSVPMLVIRGLDESTFTTIDTGKGRSPGNILGIAGHADPNSLAAVANAHLLTISGQAGVSMFNRNPGLTKQEIIQHANEIAPRFQEVTRRIPRNVSRVVSRSHAMALCLYCEDIGAGDRAAEFFRRVAEGDFYDYRTPTSHPGHALRERMIQFKTERSKSLIPSHAYCLSAKALHKFITRQNCRLLKFGAGEKFALYSMNIALAA